MEDEPGTLGAYVNSGFNQALTAVGDWGFSIFNAELEAFNAPRSLRWAASFNLMGTKTQIRNAARDLLRRNGFNAPELPLPPEEQLEIEQARAEQVKQEERGEQFFELGRRMREQLDEKLYRSLLTGEFPPPEPGSTEPPRDQSSKS
ncbi:hypothetical protein HED60_14945 [Planctomycetales bacterium ZRK34]|nr:hypothetical protein HED60_14945 [Planctomycetales bacterium ZRK34]